MYVITFWKSSLKIWSLQHSSFATIILKVHWPSTAKKIHQKTTWLIYLFCVISSIAVWHETDVRICLYESYTFTALDLRSTVLVLWYSVFKGDRDQFVDKFLLHNLFWCNVLMKTSSSFSLLLVIVLHLHNNDVSTVNDVNIADSLEALFVPLSKKRCIVKIWFLHLRLILLCQILCAPFKLTEKCWTLVYINGSFNVTWLMTMF